MSDTNKIFLYILRIEFSELRKITSIDEYIITFNYKIRRNYLNIK